MNLTALGVVHTILSLVAVTETLTRVPPGALIIAGPDAPIFTLATI